MAIGSDRAAREAATAWARVSARAELLRLGAVVALVGVMVGFVIVRAPLVQDGARLAAMSLAIFGGLVAHAGMSGWMVRRARKRGEEAAGWVRWWGVLFESAMPTLVLVIVMRVEHRGAEEALRSPAVLLYMLLLVLSPLRLRAGVSAVVGLISGGGYAWLVWRTESDRAAAGKVVEEAVLYTGAMWMVVGGLASACVGGELRRSVMKVLEESRARAAAEREIAAAAEVQQGLLPSEPPRFAGYEFAFWSRPAEKAGGDYYDWQALSGDRLVVTLADVTGHGLGPALMAAFCRAYARASMDGAAGLSEAMRRVNGLMMKDLPAGRFVTLAAVVLSEGDGVARLLSAGHGPNLVRRMGGAVESILPDAPPLGVVEDERFEVVRELRLEPGDALVLLTDGFFEWPGADGKMFGLERLRGAVSRGPESASGLIEAVRGEVEAYVGGVTQPDDLTIAVIRRV